MSNDIIEVIVQADKRTAREVNKITNPKMGKRHTNYEKQLKVYEIEYSLGEPFHNYNKGVEAFAYAEAGTKLRGKLLPNGRIKIIH